jgi:hypothetical protein
MEHHYPYPAFQKLLPLPYQDCQMLLAQENALQSAEFHKNLEQSKERRRRRRAPYREKDRYGQTF